MANWSRWENHPQTRVEVLVGAADGQVRVAGVQLDGHGADRMGQVPQHQRAGLVRDRGDGGHVGQGAAAVRHVGQADQRGVLVYRRAYRVGRQAFVDVGGQHPELRAALGRDPLDHVAVAGEVVLVGHDHVPPRPRVERRAGQLVQVDRGVVGDQDLSWRRAGERADQVARASGQIHPVVPRPGQGASPLRPDHALKPPHGRQRERAQGIAVQVDHGRIVEREPVAEPGQRIRRVKFYGVRPLQPCLVHTVHPNSRIPSETRHAAGHHGSRRVKLAPRDLPALVSSCD
jgi:hypothetical protein